MIVNSIMVCMCVYVCVCIYIHVCMNMYVCNGCEGCDDCVVDKSILIWCGTFVQTLLSKQPTFKGMIVDC